MKSKYLRRSVFAVGAAIAVAVSPAGCGGGGSSAPGNSANQTVSQSVGVAGGSVQLPGKATVTFPANSLDKTALVQISSKNEASPLDDVSPVYGPTKSAGYSVTLDIGVARVVGDFILFDLVLPDSFLSSIPAGHGPEAFVWLAESDGTRLGGWELVDGKYDKAKKLLQVRVPGFVVSKQAGGTGNNVRFMIGSTEGPHEDRDWQVATNAPAGGCQATAIGNPLMTMTVQEPFGELRKNAAGYKLHFGADLTAGATDPILSAGSGKIEFANVANGYEKTIVVKHSSGVRTLYAHLNSFEVPDGNGGKKTYKVNDPVTKGDQIATGVKKTAGAAGTGAIPHLHFELAASGDIFLKKYKINPLDCTGNEVAGSVEFGDNGSAADDSFTLKITGIDGTGSFSSTSFTYGPSDVGQRSYPVAINNLRIGEYKLELVCNIAPDDIGTYFVRLSDNVKFKTGAEVDRSGVLPAGGKLGETIVVYSQNSVAPAVKKPIPPNSAIER